MIAPLRDRHRERSRPNAPSLDIWEPITIQRVGRSSARSRTFSQKTMSKRRSRECVIVRRGSEVAFGPSCDEL